MAGELEVVVRLPMKRGTVGAEARGGPETPAQVLQSTEGALAKEEEAEPSCATRECRWGNGEDLPPETVQ